MFRDRIAVILILIPIGLALIAAGDWVLAAGVLILLNIAAVEMSQLIQRSKLRVPSWFLCAGVSALILLRQWFGFDHSPLAITTILAFAMALFLVRFARGDSRAATGMLTAIGAVLYLGWLGGYFLSIRNLPDGMWWTLIIFPSVWLADSCAFLVGRRFGRHSLAPLISPKKTWEGFAGGVLGGTATAVLFAGLWSIVAEPGSGIHMLNGLVIGFVISVVSPLGDLAVSMMKREWGAKDSGDMLPGHGGMLDRIDSWLISAAIGYYAVHALLMLPQ